MKELKENLASVFTQQGGWKYRHMGNILSNSQYSLIAINIPYVVHPKPVPPLVIVISSTAVQSGNLVWAHSEALRERKELLNIDGEAKKQLQEVFPPGDIARTHELHRSFKKMRVRDLLSHAIVQYPIDPFMISENKLRIKEVWGASAPFADLVESAFEIQDFALDVGRQIHDEEIITEV